MALHGCVPFLLLALLATPLVRAAEKELGWSDTAELSYVFTAGNSESDTLGFKNALMRTQEHSLFRIRAGGIRVETTDILKEAFAMDPNNITSDTVSVRETKDSEISAENYYVDGRYDRESTDRFFWFVGLGWDRNRFAGIDNRYSSVAGVGNIWLDREDHRFRTDYGVSYTVQKDVIETPGVNDGFLGARVSSDYLKKLGDSTTYTNVLILDENLDRTGDWRADMINSLSVAMSERMALKVSLQWRYDNEPSFEEVVVAFDTTQTPVPVATPVQVELDELDTIFTASLVVNF